jgi:hypothetical protein
MDWSQRGSSHKTSPPPQFKVPLLPGPGRQRTGVGRGWIQPPPFVMGAMGTDLSIPPLMPVCVDLVFNLLRYQIENVQIQWCCNLVYVYMCYHTI